MLDKAQRRMTPEEFYAWQETMDERYELVDGYPVPRCPDIEMTTGASRRHDQSVANILRQLGNKLDGSPCRVFTADTAVRTRAGRRRPDVGAECGAFDEESFEAGEVRMVGEVLSPSTRDLDTFGSLDEYKAIGTIDHIVIIEPNSPQAVLWSRHSDRAWWYAKIDGIDATIDLAALGVALSLRECYSGLTFRIPPKLVE